MTSTKSPALCLLVLAPLAFAACGGGAGRYQGMTAEQLFATGSSEFENGDYDNAIETLDRLLLTYGNWPRVAEARLMLGDAHFAKKEFLTARTQYQRFLDRYSGHPSSPDAALGICRSLASLSPAPERDQSYTQEAIASCRNVVIDYAGLPQAEQAAAISNQLRLTLAEKEYKIGQFYQRRRLYDSAILYYEMVVRVYPETDWAAHALVGVYESNLAIGYDDLAEDAKQRLLTEYPDSEAAALLRENGSSD